MKALFLSLLLVGVVSPSWAQSTYSFTLENKEYLCDGFAQIGKEAMVLRQSNTPKEEALVWASQVSDKTLQEGASHIVEDAYNVSVSATQEEKEGLVVEFESLIKQACLQSFNPK